MSFQRSVASSRNSSAGSAKRPTNAPIAAGPAPVVSMILRRPAPYPAAMTPMQATRALAKLVIFCSGSVYIYIALIRRSAVALHVRRAASSPGACF